MGIGSFFSSLFQKEDKDHRDIREMNVEPAFKDRAQADQKSEETRRESGPKKEVPVREKTVVKEDGLNKKGNAPARQLVSDKAAVPGREGRSADKEDPDRQAKREYFQKKKGLYQHINQLMRLLYAADQEDSWDNIEGIEGVPAEIASDLERIRGELPDQLQALVDPFINEENLGNPSSLKQAFYDMLLPFYPLYHNYFGEFRFNTFLNREALDLFRRLTGRKFRLGYRNRYSEGSPAFEWEGDCYKVYDSKGRLLCNAVFENGSVKDGYAVLPTEESEDPDWSLRKKGNFRDGVFTDGALEYVYKKPIDL